MKKFFLFVLLLILVFSCKKEADNNLFYVDPKFSPYISAFSSGLVSTQDPIKIVLQQSIKDSTVIQNQSLFQFSPSIEGKVTLERGNTLVFTPDKPLKQNQLYKGKFKLKEMQKEIPDSVRIFPFNFQTLQQDFNISIESVQSVKGTENSYIVSGKVISNDYISTGDLEKIFESKFQNKEIEPAWTHDGNTHYFSFADIRRQNKETLLDIEVEGEELGAEDNQETQLSIPKKKDLKLIQIKGYSQPDQYIAVNFSEPIVDKNLEGMFSLENHNIKSIIVEGNIVKLYPAEKLSGKYELTVWNGIEDIHGKKTQEKYIQSIQLNSLLPQVEFVGNGNIVPQNKGVKVPFRAIGLRAVDVKITKIFNNNIHQFFQFNQYAQTQKLHLLGRKIYTTTINLNQSLNFNSEQSKVYAVDIEKIVEKDPAAMYNIELSFKKEYGQTTCNEDTSPFLEKTEPIQDEWEEDTDMHSYYDRYDYYPDDYNWQDRDNPCTVSYYTQEKFVNKNILTSNIGLTAKISADRKLHIAAADLLSTDPLSYVEITALDLQNQEVGKGKTDKKGFASFDLNRKPFLIKAKHKEQFAYLRVDEGSVLNYSQFDIDGLKMNRGINGFIYGERGVWRPGDSIFLTFVAHSETQLPKGVPATFQLFNTDNQLIDSEVVQPTGDHFYSFKTATKAEDKTGNYNLKVNYAGIPFQKNIKIETIKPNRLKINTQFPAKTLTSESAPIQIESHWLTGSTASNLKVVTEAAFQPITTSFEGYKNYEFDDPSKSINTESQVVLATQLNSEGKTTLSSKWQPKSPTPGMLKVGFFTKVFEKGGEFSSSYSSVDYSPYTSYVGFKLPDSYTDYQSLDTDKNHTIQVVTVDSNGKPIEAEVELKVYKINNSWWYNSNSTDLAYYVNDSHHAEVLSEKKQSGNGKAQFEITMPERNWGNYFILIKNLNSGHSAGKRVWFDSPYGYENDENNESAALMVVQTDKDVYKVGEKAKITIPKSLEGKALLSFESGSKVIKEEWVDTKKDQTNIEISITEDLAPNFYLNISLIQPHQNTVNDLPIRLYGLKNIEVKNPKRELHPSLSTPTEITPNSQYSIAVQEKNGKPMTYTLAVVDEGLLDLTQFKTPNIYNHFNAKQSLGVKSWDIYHYVLGAYGGRIESVFAIGGDMALQQSNKEKINRFKPVVQYLGPYTLKANQKKTHQLTMNNYVGSVKVMLVAANEIASGTSEKSIKVKQPLMTLSTLPRTLSPGDEIKMPISIFSEKEDIKNVSIQIKSNDKIMAQGATTQTINFDKTGEKLAYFSFKVPEKLGKATIEINAQSGKYASVEKFEVEVRAPNPYITKSQTKEIGQSALNFNSNPHGMAGTNTTLLELSTLPISDFTARLDNLIHYPYGCVEQTVSGIFPQLYLDEITQLSSEQSEDIQKHILYGMEELKRFQLSNGSLSYWPGGSYSSSWGSVYALHFLNEAKNKGYKVPEHLYTQLIEALQNEAKRWDYYVSQIRGYKSLQAYRLYVLALAKKGMLSEMNRLKESSLQPVSKYLLANAYFQMGKSSVAQNLIQNTTWSVPDYSYNEITYGSGLRDRAMILMCLAEMKQKDKAFTLLKDVGKSLNSGSWYSTQTTAMSLLGISKFLEGKYASNIGIDATLTINGKSQRVQSSKGIYVLKYPADNAQTIQIKNGKQGFLFATISQTGIPSEVIQESKESDLKMQVSYTDLDGNPIDINRLSQNTDFQAHVHITHPGFRDKYHNMALNQMFPSGWEIVNMRVFTDNYSMPKGIDYQNFRDDRVYSFFDLNPSKEVTVTIRLNATYQGTYILPSTHCEAMYESDIFAYSKGQKVEVY